MKTLPWAYLLWSTLGVRTCASAEGCIFSLLSQPFSQWIGLCLKFHTFFCQLKGSGEETKTQNQQRRYEGQVQETCIALALTRETAYRRGYVMTAIQCGYVSMHAIVFLRC